MHSVQRTLATVLLPGRCAAAILSVAVAISAIPTIARADTIFEDEQGSHNRIGAYSTSGATVNASLITGLSGPQGGGPQGIAVSGSNLFVAYGGGVVTPAVTKWGSTPPQEPR
jgi:hypothetical protein